MQEQQIVKYGKSLVAQKAKTDRGVQRDCTEGNSFDCEINLSAAKQQHKSCRFTKEKERTGPLLKLSREQGCDDED